VLQRIWICGVVLAGCSGGKVDPDAGCEPDCEETAPTDDTGATEDTTEPADDTDPGSSQDDTASGDTAPPEDTDLPSYYNSDTGEVSCDSVTFTGLDGAVVDYTAAFTDGTEIELEDAGTLSFCPGEWFVRLTVKEADVDIVGLGETRDETVISAGELGTVLSFRGPGQTINLSNLVVERGAALGSGNRSSGGGLRCTDDTNINIQDVTFTRNRAYDGAAIYAAETCHVAIYDTLFADNDTVDDGAGVRIDGGSAEVYDSTFSGNTARDGAAAFTIYGDMSFENCIFEDNWASYYGGAMVNYYGTIEVRDSTFIDHSASISGGVFFTIGDLTLENVTLDTSTAREAAIYTYGSYGAVEGVDVTFIDSDPADIYVYATGGGPGGGGGAYDFEPNASFTCDNLGCETH